MPYQPLSLTPGPRHTQLHNEFHIGFGVNLPTTGMIDPPLNYTHTVGGCYRLP